MDPQKIHEHIDRNMTRIIQYENQLGELFVLPKNWHFRVYRWLALFRPEALMGDAEEITGEAVFDVCVRLDFRERHPFEFPT